MNVNPKVSGLVLYSDNSQQICEGFRAERGEGQNKGAVVINCIDFPFSLQMMMTPKVSI